MTKSYYLFLFYLLGIYNSANAQQIPNQEIKVNSTSGIFKSALDLQYEKFINNEMSLGISAYQTLTQNPQMVVNNFRTNSFTFFTKNYFDNTNHKGKFLEIFTMLNHYKVSHYNFEINNDKITKKINLAIGLSGGYKWVSNKGFITEIAIGIGRNISNASEDELFVGRGGILLGKRF